MLVAEVGKRLATCGLPVAYRFFPKKDAPDLPYVVWYVSAETNFPADGENYCNIKQITVELYTKLKDPAAEEAVEAALSFAVWTKTEEYIDREKCYQIVYYMEV